MKKILAFGLIPFFAFGAIPDSADGWWTPQGGYSELVTQGAIYTLGNKTHACVVNENGGDVLILWDTPPKEPDKTAIEKALSAYSLAVYNEERIAALGENLHAVFSTDGITITGTTPDGSTQSYTIKFTPGGGLGNDSGTIQATTEHMQWNLADEKSLKLLQGNKIEIAGWNSTRTQTTLAQCADNHSFIIRPKTGGSPYYLDVGELKNLMPDIDSRTFTTNGQSKGRLELRDMASVESLVGASHTSGGEAVMPNFWNGWELTYNRISDFFEPQTFEAETGSTDNKLIQLKGWTSASEYTLPMKKKEDAFEWTVISDLLEENSLKWDEESYRIEVKGASEYAGRHANHYFGTSKDESAVLGWHELPNVTTNYVEGDEITISSTIKKVNGFDAKIVGLKGWNENYNGTAPLILVNEGGALEYRPLPDINTNVAYNCTNLWKETVAWFGDDARNNSGSDFIKNGNISFTDDSLSDFLKRNHFVFFENGGEDEQFSFTKNVSDSSITSSFDAPENWADDTSIGLTAAGKYEIKGFSSQPACDAKLSTMLTDPNDVANRNEHLIITKFTGSGGGLHYLPVGDLLEIGVAMKVDEKSIVTNETDGAFIHDFDTANDGEFPIKQDGVIKWIPTNEIHRVETMGNFAYNPETKQIAAGAVCIGRTYYRVNGMSAEGLSGSVRVEINMETKQAVLASGDGFAAPTDTMSYVPIYVFSNGQIVSDYRGAPVVQCYEDDTTEGTSE